MSDTQEAAQSAAEPEATTPPAAEPPAPPAPGPGGAKLEELVAQDRARREQADTSRRSAQEAAQYKELVNIALNDPDRFAELAGKKKKPAPQKTDSLVEERFATLEQKLAKFDEERKSREQRQQLSEIEKSVGAWVSEKADEFPLINALGFEGAVYDRMLAAARTGQALSEHQAASELEESLAGRLDKLASVPKLRELVSGKQSTEHGQARTLSNDLTAEASSRREPSDDLSEEESLERMAEMLRKAIT